MNIYSKMKHKILSEHPDVIDEYTKYINNYGNKTLSQKARAYKYLASLMLRGEKKLIKVEQSEYADNKRRSLEEWTEVIKQYDVISFDLFDTLLLRTMDKPEDAFDLVGTKLQVDAFRSLRKFAEDKTREHQKFYHLRDVYRRLKRYIHVDPDLGVKTEYEMELSLCRVNPYLKAVMDLAVQEGKKVIVITDTYYNTDEIGGLIRECGYDSVSKVYSSFDCKKDKQTGELFDLVRMDFPDMKILHIGDNLNSDVENAKKKGFDAWHYDSVHEEGRGYRPNTADTITTSVTNALINNELHNGMTELSDLEQYGFTYGGALVSGFCDWLQRIGREYRFDSMIFLSRDARIFYDEYRKFYEEDGFSKAKYAYVSRTVALQLLIADYPELFIKKVLKQYSFAGKMTVAEVLTETGIAGIIDELDHSGIKSDSIFDAKTLSVIEQYIYKEKEKLAEAFSVEREAAKNYWTELLGDDRKVLLVDDGLHGTIYVCLEHFLREICGIEVELYNAQLGTLKDSFNQRLMMEGKMLSYGFSSDMNKDIGSLFSNGIEVSIMESFLSEDIGSLKAYSMDEDKKTTFDYYPTNSNGKYIRQIHKGIGLFVKKYTEAKKKTGLPLYIDAPSAFGEMLQVIQSPAYLDRLLGEYIYIYIRVCLGFWIVRKTCMIGLCRKSMFRSIETINEDIICFLQL